MDSAFAPDRGLAPRKALTRPAHLCRGRGGRGCRCHMAARPRLFRHAPVLAGDLGLPPRRLTLAQPLDSAAALMPRRPQAPPILFAETPFHGFRTGQTHVIPY